MRWNKFCSSYIKSGLKFYKSNRISETRLDFQKIQWNFLNQHPQSTQERVRNKGNKKILSLANIVVTFQPIFLPWCNESFKKSYFPDLYFLGTHRVKSHLKFSNKHYLNYAPKFLKENRLINSECFSNFLYSSQASPTNNGIEV